MAKIVINKNFQSKYLYRAYERLVKPDKDITTYVVNSIGSSAVYDFSARGHISYYTDLSSIYKSTWQGVSINDWPYDGTKVQKSLQYFVCDETFITLLNKINKTIKDGMSSLPKIVDSVSGNIAVTSSNKTAEINMVLLVTSLFSSNVTIRNNTIDYFVGANIISLSDGNTIKNILSGLKLIDNNVSIDNNSITYVPKVSNITTGNVSNSSMDLTLGNTLRLDNPYIKTTDNPTGTNLYVLVIPYIDTKFPKGGDGKTLTFSTGQTLNPLLAISGTNNEYSTGVALAGYNCFHRKDTNTVVNQIPYIALSLTETGLGGDIEYDHLDEIEYLDEIKVTIALPKEYI